MDTRRYYQSYWILEGHVLALFPLIVGQSRSAAAFQCQSVWANHVLLLRSNARGHWPITVGDGVPKE
eukprot:scaffold19050_cov73-Cylindrotheca_fusiformis.AAC.1